MTTPRPCLCDDEGTCLWCLIRNTIEREYGTDGLVVFVRKMNAYEELIEMLKKSLKESVSAMNEIRTGGAVGNIIYAIQQAQAAIRKAEEW